MATSGAGIQKQARVQLAAEVGDKFKDLTDGIMKVFGGKVNLVDLMLGKAVAREPRT